MRSGRASRRRVAPPEFPLWSPHDLRHRRISLLHRQGRTWAEIGALVGQRSLKVTSDTYAHMLVDSRDLDYAALVARP